MFIHTGSNDARQCHDISVIVHNIIRSAVNVTLGNPHITHVIISQMLQCLKPEMNWVLCQNENTIIDQINNQVRILCKTLPFIFMENSWVEKLDHNWYVKDGVHLNLEGNELFASNIFETITTQSPLHFGHDDPISVVFGYIIKFINLQILHTVNNMSFFFSKIKNGKKIQYFNEVCDALLKHEKKDDGIIEVLLFGTSIVHDLRHPSCINTVWNTFLKPI